MSHIKEMSESGAQFAAIFEDYHDPVKGEEKRIKENREKRAKQIKEDSGL